MQSIFQKVIPPGVYAKYILRSNTPRGVYIYIYLYIFEAVLRQFRGRAQLCENAVLGTCDGEHGGCLNICRKGHAVHMHIFQRQF